MISVSGTTMGTLYRIKILTPEVSQQELSQISKAVIDALDRINHQMNHYDPESEISRFNALGAGERFPIRQEFQEVLQLSFDLHESTEGAFDVTLGTLVDLWGFGPLGRQRISPPTSLEVQAALRTVGQDQLALDRQGRISKSHPELKLNLSAIAKGYAVDQIAKTLKGIGYENFMVEIGGEVFASGTTFGEASWTIGIRQPDPKATSENTYYKKVLLNDQALATSGYYENYFEFNGRRYMHILDPHTGEPVSFSIASVSIIAPTAAMADASATAVTVLGADDGLTWVESQPKLEVLFILLKEDGSFQEMASSGFSRYVD